MERADYTQPHKQLTISQFKPEHVEEASLNVLQQDLFKCVCFRAFVGDNLLPGLVSLVSCVTITVTDKELSKVVYAEIVSERAML